MTNEQWGILVGIAALVIPWALSVHGKLARMAHSFESIEKLWERYDELNGKVSGHAVRLDEHGKRFEHFEGLLPCNLSETWRGPPVVTKEEPPKK